MGRDECIETIEKASLPLPGKSACFFCPSTRKSEIMQLKEQYPDLMDRAIAIEQGADLRSIKGLGRGFAWADLIKQGDIFGFDSPIEMACDCYDG